MIDKIGGNKMKKMYGVNTPLSCPMTEKGAVDYGSLRNLCDYLIEKGVNGLYPNGSTGEMCYLSKDERKKILECVLDANGGRIQVFSMVGALTTSDTVELAKHAQEAGADGIGVVTPFYFKLDEEELFRYFVEVASSVREDFPVYLYGIPQLAVNDITPALADRIARECPNVVGIKYSYPDMPRLLQFMEVRDGNFSVLAGPDDLFFALLASGGDGTISGNSNVIPEHYVAIYKAFQEGDLETARKLQVKVNRLITCISGPNNMARYKAALKHRGIIASSAVRKPLRELTREEEKEFIGQIERMGYTDITRY